MEMSNNGCPNAQNYSIPYKYLMRMRRLQYGVVTNPNVIAHYYAPASVQAYAPRHGDWSESGEGLQYPFLSPRKNVLFFFDFRTLILNH
jgi:hypothetical protein